MKFLLDHIMTTQSDPAIRPVTPSDMNSGFTLSNSYRVSNETSLPVSEITPHKCCFETIVIIALVNFCIKLLLFLFFICIYNIGTFYSNKIFIVTWHFISVIEILKHNGTHKFEWPIPYLLGLHINQQTKPTDYLLLEQNQMKLSYKQTNNKHKH